MNSDTSYPSFSIPIDVDDSAQLLPSTSILIEDLQSPVSNPRPTKKLTNTPTNDTVMWCHQMPRELASFPDSIEWQARELTRLISRTEARVIEIQTDLYNKRNQLENLRRDLDKLIHK